MICACGCKRRFTPVTAWSLYATKECGNRARVKRHRERHKMNIGDRVKIKPGVTPHGGKLGVIKEVEGLHVAVWLDLMSNASTPHLKRYLADEVAKVT